MTLTAPPNPDAPAPGTGTLTGQPATTLQQLPREYLTAPSGIRAFPTPEETKGKVLTLEDSIKIALDNQPLILARIGDYQAQLQNIAIALSPQLPQLSGQWNGFWNQVPSSVQSPAGQAAPLSMTRNVTVQSRFLSTSATVTAQQLLWDFGKTLAATDAARAGAKSSAENVEIQKQETVRLVKEAYYSLALSNRLVQVSQAQLDRALVNLRSAKGFFDVGTQPKSAVTRAEVDVATAQLSIIQAVNNVNIFRLTINQLMGIPINTPTEIQDNLAYEHVDFDAKSLLNESFARRPEYRQIKAQYDQADFTVKQQFRNFFPNVIAQGTYGSARADMNETYSYGLQLNWTIFDGGNKIALYKQAQANRDAAQARVRDTGPRARHRADDLAAGGAGVRHRAAGRGSHRRRREGRGVGRRELPAEPGAVRRRRRQYYRADGRPAGADQRPSHCRAGPRRLPDCDSPARAVPGPPLGAPRGPGGHPRP